MSRVGKISELTDIPRSWCQRIITKYAQYDVTNQNMNRTMWELICLDEGGPQLADLEVEIITPEVGIPLARSKENPTKVRAWSGCLCCQTLEAILARWLVHGPADHKGAFQTFYPPTVTSWWVYGGQMSSSQPVWQKEGGCQRLNRGSFDIIVLFPLPDLLWFELWWITLYEFLWSSSI